MAVVVGLIIDNFSLWVETMPMIETSICYNAPFN